MNHVHKKSKRHKQFKMNQLFAIYLCDQMAAMEETD